MQENGWGLQCFSSYGKMESWKTGMNDGVLGMLQPVT